MNIIDKLYEDTPLIELASDIQALIEEKENYKKALELVVKEQFEGHPYAFPAHDPNYWIDQARKERAQKKDNA